MFGIIGGTGLYNLDGLKIIEEIKVETPFGDPSDVLIKGRFGSQEIIFLPRHGKTHSLLPSEVNYRGNIFALKKLGVTQLIGISAVGSLKKEIVPGDLAIPDQYFDWTRGTRKNTFFGKGLIAHISTAKPTCPCLTKSLVSAGNELNMTVHHGKAYACVEGPRLGSQVESHFLRNSAQCDLVGMTNVPEAFLAREAQICYATITIATDYDCWLDDPEEHVSVAMVFKRYGESLDKVKSLLKHFLGHDNNSVDCQCRSNLQDAVITPENVMTEAQKEIFHILKQ